MSVGKIARRAVLFAAIPTLASAQIGELVRVFRIPSASMAPTLVPGDFIIARRMASYAPGDVVLWLNPAEDRWWINRIMAVAGQRIGFVNGRPVIDGEPVTQTLAEPQPALPEDIWPEAASTYRETFAGRSYLVRHDDHGTSQYANRREVEVPEGRVFLVGDNRDNSADNRMYGPASLSDIHYRAMSILISGFGPRAATQIE